MKVRFLQDPPLKEKKMEDKENIMSAYFGKTEVQELEELIYVYSIEELLDLLVQAYAGRQEAQSPIVASDANKIYSRVRKELIDRYGKENKNVIRKISGV